MIHSLLYATKDEVSSVDNTDYYVVVVHVCDSSLSQAGIQSVTQLASQYMSTETSLLYVVHVFPNDNHRIDFSFGDAGNENAVQHLQNIVEKDGILPFLRAISTSFSHRLVADMLTCNFAHLQFESQPELEDGVHEVALDPSAPKDMNLPLHAPMRAFLAMCRAVDVS
jgi:hypothetical protein